MIHFTPFTSLKPRPKASLWIAAVVCPAALLVIAFGLWRWALAIKATDGNATIYLAAYVVVPAIAFAAASFRAAQRLEYDRLNSSFITHINQLQTRLKAEDELLNSLTDYNTEALVIFDKDNKILFANNSAAKMIGVADAKILVNTSLAQYPHIDRSFKLKNRLAEIRRANRPIEAVQQFSIANNQVQFLQACYEPTKPSLNIEQGVLIRWKDVTTLMVQHERSENMLRQIMKTLVAMIDRRDPFSAGHSERVSELARAIAEELILPQSEIEAAGIAGALMNFGKVFVPQEILTRQTSLDAAELKMVREAMYSSAEILSMIDFSTPVVPTLQQAQEHFDGSGMPRGLQGGQILMTSRIIAVANAYVALVSSRAHRDGLSSQDALAQLYENADKMFDRKVITALASYLENRKNKPGWLEYLHPVKPS